MSQTRIATAAIAAVLAASAVVAVAGTPTQLRTVIPENIGEGPTPFPLSDQVPPPRVSAISLDAALRTYLRGAVSVIDRPAGMRFIDCADKVAVRLTGDEAALALAMQDRAGTELARVLVPMHGKFVAWYRSGFPRAVMATAELTALYREYVMARMTRTQADAVRPFVADAVIAAGLPRAEDLLVTPVLAARGPVLGNTCRCYGQPCICSPGMVCSCQTSNPQGDDCDPPAASCNAEDFPEQKLVTVGR